MDNLQEVNCQPGWSRWKSRLLYPIVSQNWPEGKGFRIFVRL